MPATCGNGGAKVARTRWLATMATLLSAVAMLVMILYVDSFKKYVKTAKIKRDLGLPVYRVHGQTVQPHYVPGSEMDRIRSCGGKGNSQWMTIHMVHTASSSHGTGGLPARYACAVEAAAATGANVVIHSTDLEAHQRPEDVLWPSPPLQPDTPNMRRRKRKASAVVRFEHIDLSTIFHALPLESWFEREIAAVSSYAAPRMRPMSIDG